MSFEIDRDPEKEPALWEMADKALKILSNSDKKKKGFFLMIGMKLNTKIYIYTYIVLIKLKYYKKIYYLMYLIKTSRFTIWWWFMSLYTFI